MILVLGTIHLPPENLLSARDAMQEMITASRAEPGCMEYAYAEDVLSPGLIHVKEFWQTQRDLDLHFGSDHIKVWRSQWPKLGISDRNLVRYEVGEAITT